MRMEKDWFGKWAGYAPIKTVVSDAVTGELYTYQQVHHIAGRLARACMEKGLQPGDRIAVLAEYSPQYVLLLGLAMKTGLILVPLNYRLSGRELAYMIGQSEPSLLLYDERHADLAQDACADSPYLEHQSLDVFCHTAMNPPQEEQTFEAREIPDDHPLFILYTSGTTGFPKGALYTYRMAFWNAVNTQIRLDITSRDHTLICMPPFHTGGWNVLLMPFLLQGGSFTLLRKFEADQVLHLLENEEVTLFMGVPTMMKMMADDPAFQELELESLRYCIVGGEAMPIPLIRTWEHKGVPIRQGFGLTEVGPNVFSLHHDDAIRKIGSIGTPNFFLDLKLMKADGTEAGTEEEGELWLKGDIATPGYWQNEMATQEAYHEGWFRTGDILTRDADGYYYVRDRIKNMFISGGENVYPAEVERWLHTHPAIEEVAVIGVPDPKWGEVGKAIMVCGDDPLSIEEVVAFCREKLARFKIPKYVAHTDALPKTDSGKVDRKQLKALYLPKS